jgi:photosystem II stability/assembly factor-like uncharacterized protein
MKRLFYILLFFIPVIAFPQWYWQNPLPQGNLLSSVFFTDSNNGYAVGTVGTIIKTTDGGVTWSIYSSGPNNGLSSIFFTDNNTGYTAGQDIVTDKDLILKTTDAGSTWNTVLSGTGYGIYSIFFPTDNVGYGVGMFGEIVKTTDAGVTWTYQNSGITDDLECVYFTDTNTGYVGSYLGIILKTNNGGTTWDSVTTTGGKLYSIFFTDANNGYTTGNYVYRTINAGVTWTLDMNGLGQYDGYTFQSVFFTDQNTGYVSDGSGDFFKTTNAGATWNFESVAQEQGCQAMYFTNANTGYMIGGAELSQTLDGGSNWNQISYGTNNGYALYTVFFPDESTGYAGGLAGLFMKTTDGGVNWSSSYVYCGGRINSLYFTSINNGFMVGGEYMAKTTDGGTTWTQMQSGTTMGLNSIFFTNANTGYVVGGYYYSWNSWGIILKTTDAGVTWTSTLVNYDLTSVYFPDSHTGYAVGMDSATPYGVIVKTTDGGITWNKLPYRPEQELYSVFFTNDNTGYAVGYEGVNLKTTDGGANWTSLNINNGGCSFYSVFFITPSKGYVVDECGDIFYTTDAGSTWRADSSGTENTLYSVFFTDTITGYAVGALSNILKKGYGGWTSVKEKEPNAQKFILYPNPANKEITIELSSSPEPAVQLSILNINGQQLITRQITELRTQIDISSLPSGVYFVRVTNDKTVEVGKFVKE